MANNSLSYGGDRDDLTICAVATPFGYGGISVIRISGPEALDITRKIAAFLPHPIESHKAYFGTLADSSGSIDEVLVTYFADGKSFTGEEVLEISCHGNPLICDFIINSLSDAGAVLAGPGEFTYRAFINGKLDLAQAESVLTLIQSRSKKSSQISLRHLKGEVSDNIHHVESELLWILAHSEAQIDFSSEVIKAASEDEIKTRLKQVIQKVSRLASSFSSGRVVNEGLRIGLIGKPNVGKSSLYNNLLQKDRAIVSDIPGTTRDLLETTMSYKGSQLILTDTAGLRFTSADSIEHLGIKKTIEEVKDIDVVLWLQDLTLSFSSWAEMGVNIESVPNMILIGTKVDIARPSSIAKFRNQAIEAGIISGTEDKRFLTISNNDSHAREQVLDLVTALYAPVTANDETFVIHQRQHENLKEIQAHLVTALETMESGIGYEFVSLELKTAMMKTQEIIGKVFDDQILDRVFKEFCIGK